MDGRFRFVSTDVTRERGSRLRVRVELELDGQTVSGETRGIGLETMELRLAAEATISAIDQGVGQDLELRLVGIKRMHAFDSDVVLVAVREGQARASRPLIGAVPVEENLAEGAALAILSATNRRLGRVEAGGKKGKGRRRSGGKAAARADRDGGATAAEGSPAGAAAESSPARAASESSPAGAAAEEDAAR